MSDVNRPSVPFLRILGTLFPIALAASPGLFLTGNVVGIVHGAGWGLNTLATQLFFDAVARAVSRTGNLAHVVAMAAVLTSVILGLQVLNGVHNFMGDIFSRKMEGALNVRMQRKTARIDPVLFEDPTFLDDINKAREGVGNSVGLLFVVTTLFTFYLPYFVFMGIYLFRLKPVLALSLVLVFLPVAATQLLRAGVFSRLEDQAAPVRREYEYYERCLVDREYFKETRILGGFGYFAGLYRTALRLLSGKMWVAERRTGLAELGMRMLTLAGYFGILLLLFAALLKGEISVGAFAAVFASIGALFSIMEELVSRHIGTMARDWGSVRNLVRLLSLPERGGQDADLDAGKGIAFRDVTFRYPGAKEDCIRGVTLEIRPGETVAIVGENGAGKTTLVRLMTGLYLPSGGEVMVGGVDTRKASLHSVYRGFSAVFQKFQRYKMTLADNISISSEQSAKPREAALADAAANAQLEVRPETFPHGYSTNLSREFDGVDLSGGQWQRVAIARGFYRAHGVIVLDEPTAAIDPLEETRIYKQFAEISRGKTAVVITHRLGSARIADRIVVMSEGRIVETGTHEELVSADAEYARMFRAQAQWYLRDE